MCLLPNNQTKRAWYHIKKGVIEMRTQVVILFITMLLYMPISAIGAQAQPQSCSNSLYHVISGDLFTVNAKDGMYTRLNPADDYAFINAIGYNSFPNSLQNLICGRAYSSDPVHGFTAGDFLCYDTNGVIVKIVTPANGPIPFSNAGDFDASGHLYMKDSFSPMDLIRLDTNVDPPVWTIIPFGVDPSCPELSRIGDIAYVSTDIDHDGVEEELFLSAKLSDGGARQVILIWNLETQVLSCKDFTGILDPTAGEGPSLGFGAVYTDNQGRLLLSRNTTIDGSNGTGQLYLVNNFRVPVPQAEFLFDTIRTTQNDGAFCVLNPFPLELTGQAPTQIPTLSEWVLLILSIAFGAICIYYLKIRQRGFGTT